MDDRRVEIKVPNLVCPLDLPTLTDWAWTWGHATHAFCQAEAIFSTFVFNNWMFLKWKLNNEQWGCGCNIWPCNQTSYSPRFATYFTFLPSRPPPALNKLGGNIAEWFVSVVHGFVIEVGGKIKMNHAYLCCVVCQLSSKLPLAVVSLLLIGYLTSDVTHG